MKKLLLLKPDELRVHEAVDPKQVGRLLDIMKSTGRFHPPLLVDCDSKVILDGHHRYWASRELGCRRIPCYCVKYLSDDGIVLKSWRPNLTVTKEQVIEMGLGKEVFPLKTTRHIYDLPASLEPIPTDELMKADPA